MILHRNHRRFRVERAIGVAQPQNICELQRCSAGEEYFPAGSEFEDGILLHHRAAASARELNGDTNRSGLRKKARQIRNRVGLRYARLSCGLLRQAVTLSLDSSGFKLSAVGLPLFPVRKTFGEPEHAVMPEEMHDRVHSAERKD